MAVSKIAFFTEMGFSGKVPRDHSNARTEFAWMIALDADHYPIASLPQVPHVYDLGIIILPKTNIESLSTVDIPSEMRRTCKNIAVMQEGPHTYFQDYPLAHQIWYYNTLMEMDILYCHNLSDVDYYHGLTNKPCRRLQSLMIEDTIGERKKQQHSTIIGGNMCSWYGGFDSYTVASELDFPIESPSMGRMADGEDQLDNLTHLPYMNWNEWVDNLSKYKYAIHLMRTHAAGTFALNCAYWGIPCIGYYGLDTQMTCHPLTTCQLGDLSHASEIIKRLKKDYGFYKEQSEFCRMRYEENFSESVFKDRWNEDNPEFQI